MANITPITTTSDSGYTNAARDMFYWDTSANTAILTSNKRLRLHGAQLLSYYFADADSLEDFAGVRGALACAWQANTTADTVATLVSATGNETSVRFTTGATNPTGWLHVLTRGSERHTATTDEAPVSKGTSGWVDPARAIFLSHRHASPNNLTNAKIGCKLGYKLQVFPFVPSDTSDTWLSESSGLCPGIVAVAWQPSVGTARVAVTQEADGDVVFTGESAPVTGWLWVWRNRS